MAGAVVLVPSSKGKTEGGDGPAYAESASVTSHPLGEARRTVLDALAAAADDLDDRGIGRLCGVRDADAPEHRARLRAVAGAPTLPAVHRYAGVVHRYAELGERPVDADVDVGFFGGLLGVAWLDDAVPGYRLEVTGRVPELGVLGTWWREAIADHLGQRAAGRLVYDLLPGEHARMWPESRRGDLDVVRVAFRRPDGRAAPSASTKVAKGRLLRLLLDAPELTPDELAGTDEIPGWKLHPADDGLEAVQVG